MPEYNQKILSGNIDPRPGLTIERNKITKIPPSIPMDIHLTLGEIFSLNSHIICVITIINSINNDIPKGIPNLYDQSNIAL